MDKRLNVFFTASYYGKKKYQRYYDLVLATIEACPVEVIGTEKGNYMQLLPRQVKRKVRDKKFLHYEAIRRGILWSDAVIIEMSYEDFQLGHEATLAVQAKRPVLCLSLHEDFSQKIKHEFFHSAKYNEYNIRRVIHSFLEDIGEEKFSERFNCFLSKKQVAYLSEVSKKNKLNKSEYLRKLLEEDMRLREK